MSDLYTVELTAPGPWGFRLQGGKDFSMPLTISRLTDSGKAVKAGVAIGDAVISIGDLKTEELNHLEAQNKIKECKGNLKLTLQRAASVPKPAAALKTTTVTTNTSVTVPKPSVNRGVIRKPIIQTDIGFYHEASHADASRKRIMEDTEDWRPRTGTSQSRSFHILAQITGTEALPEDMVSNKNTVKEMKIKVGPQYHKLRDWHHGVSAQTLNVLSLI